MAVRITGRGNELLVMRHKDRMDLPKGHIESNETDWECAQREWLEETGVSPVSLSIIDGCRYEVSYYANYKRFAGEKVKKTVILFGAYVDPAITINPTEHFSYDWLRIEPLKSCPSKTIEEVMAYLVEQDL